MRTSWESRGWAIACMMHVPHGKAGLSHMAAQQAPIPPLKGEVGEPSEPGGVGCNNLGRQSNPTRPPVASLRRIADAPRRRSLRLRTAAEGRLCSPERGGIPSFLPPYAIALPSKARGAIGTRYASFTQTSPARALSCQRRNNRCEMKESAKKMAIPLSDSSSSAANIRGILRR